MELIINYFNRLTLLFLQEIVQKRIERMQRKVEGMHNLSVMLEVLITILIIIILIMVEGMHNLSVMLDVLLHIKNLDKCSQVVFFKVREDLSEHLCPLSVVGLQQKILLLQCHLFLPQLPISHSISPKDLPLNPIWSGWLFNN